MSSTGECRTPVLRAGRVLPLHSYHRTLCRSLGLCAPILLTALSWCVYARGRLRHEFVELENSIQAWLAQGLEEANLELLRSLDGAAINTNPYRTESNGGLALTRKVPTRNAGSLVGGAEEEANPRRKLGMWYAQLEQPLSGPVSTLTALLLLLSPGQPRSERVSSYW